jgi:hypothetical protein
MMGLPQVIAIQAITSSNIGDGEAQNMDAVSITNVETSLRLDLEGL